MLKQQVKIQEERLKLKKEQVFLHKESVSIIRDIKTSLEQIANGVDFCNLLHFNIIKNLHLVKSI